MAAVRSGRLMGMDMGSMDLEDGRTTGKRKKGKKGGWDGYVQTHRSFSLCIYSRLHSAIDSFSNFGSVSGARASW